MPHPETPIIVVDDARFSATIVLRTLQQAGYVDVRHAESGHAALLMLDRRPAQIVIADWMMPEMDGLTLTRRIRQRDEASNHYTYILLLTAREEEHALREAFDEGVDDYVTKATMNAQLLPRVLAADRLVAVHNRVLADNDRLLGAMRRLRRRPLLDPLTGFGNNSYAQRRLDDALRQASTRGGSACLLLIRIEHFASLRERLGRAGSRQLILTFSRRLQQLVRPMDILARTGISTFALITHQSDPAQCTPQSFQRLYDNLNQRAFEVDTQQLKLHVSIGLGTSPGDVVADTATLFRRAAQAMTASLHQPSQFDRQQGH
ncbi:response regulator [Alcanivorax sp. JB21]|uniref:GGDEF domain-containing response regulator n=1 Tax=Alcanivorax limicola TaxID=2874102 RepID=UPI001CBCEF5B|nr:response regulator [Alcanivorax limicola]MBZ2189699.1 response regulator [Alcanivorax limicola]